MPILRAGPWGNLTDSFQPVPGAANTLLDHYPVNCAKANWPNQTWAAYYELTEAGCCTPETVSITNAYLSSMTRGEDCYYAEDFAGYSTTYYYNYYTQTLEYSTVDGSWTLYWDSAISFGEAYLINNDPCDPTGTYTEIYGQTSPVVSTP